MILTLFLAHADILCCIFRPEDYLVRPSIATIIPWDGITCSILCILSYIFICLPQKSKKHAYYSESWWRGGRTLKVGCESVREWGKRSVIEMIRIPVKYSVSVSGWEWAKLKMLSLKRNHGTSNTQVCQMHSLNLSNFRFCHLASRGGNL